MKKEVGYFDNEKKEYVITDMRPIRPLINYCWSEQMVASYNQFGFGTSFASLGEIRRPLEENGDNRLVYIRDNETSESYSPNRNYGDLPFDKYRCHVGLGYQKIVSEYKGVETEFTISIPSKDYAELFEIKVKNTGDKNRKLSVYLYLRPAPNLTWHTSYGTGDFVEKLQGLFFPHNGFNLEHKYTCLSLSASEKPIAFDTCDRFFVGEYNSLASPIGLLGKTLSCKGTTFEDHYAGVMQFDCVLKAGEEKCYNFCLATTTSLDESVALGKIWANKLAFDSNIIEQKQINDSYIDVFSLKCPDEYLNTMTNIWLKRQIALGKTWGRVCGKGFRDVMQDITGFVSMDASLARTRILYALKHQYFSGNPVRMYEPIFDHPYFDGAAWIPATILSYIKETGDFTILDEKIPYLDNDSLDSVFDHIYKGLRFLLDTKGEHGLTLWGGGDWNDSLNNAGMKMLGESVWLSIASVKAVAEFCSILDRMVGQDELKKSLTAEKEALRSNIIKYGFDGEYFIYGINDCGEKVGSCENDEGKLYLNAQTWAVLADILDEDGSNKLMDIVENRLKCDFGYVQLAPSYTKGTDNLGRASYFVPGMVENGSVYNHGVAFKIVADCKLSRGDNAYDTIKLISYDNPKNANSGVEPYVVSNMYIGPENPYRVGDAPMSWITGTAGWLYRSITEYLLGVSAEFDGLKINPVLPKSWNNVEVKRIFRGVNYTIKFVAGTENKLVCGGKEVVGDILPLAKKGESVQAIRYYISK